METMNTILVILLLFILPAIISAIRRRRNTKTPPGPSGLPFIGNLHQLKSPVFMYFHQLSKKYGSLIHLKIGSKHVLVANSSRMAEEILKTQDIVFCSRPAMLALRKLSYGGYDMAFAPYSEYWRNIRKTCVLNLLSAKRVQSFRPVREDEVSRMVQKISKNASLGESVNLTELIMFLTSTVISRIAFGKRFEQGSQEREDFVDIIREFQTELSSFFVTDYFPKIGWIDNLIGNIAELDKVFKKWDAFYQQLIDEHLRPDRPKSMDHDVLDILLKLREESDLRLDHIKAVLVDVYFASTDTIATTIIWAMTALIKNPRVLEKAQAEIRGTLSSRVKNEIVQEEDMKDLELPYFNAVIRETLRHYPTIPLLVPRETIKKCTIDGYEIPANTLVHVNTWGLGHDPNVWENPHEFIPERFFVDNKLIPMDIKLGNNFDFIPFGAGRRGCPGISMALATVEIVLANLLYLFDWKLPIGMKCEDVDTEILDGLTMHKKNPLCLLANKFV